MEPVTHALASVALGRAGVSRLTRRAVSMLLIAGLAAELDWVSYAAGPGAFLQWHRGAPDSLFSAAAIASAVALGFWIWGRRGPASAQRIAFLPALAVCACGSVAHVLLDLTNDTGAQALWPFSGRWFAWDWAPEIDPMLIAILLGGLLIPSLLNLVGEEIGAQGRRPVSRGAIIALCVAVAYLAGRAATHERAITVVDSRSYDEESPVAVRAYPAASPLRWRGVVETPAAMHLLDVSLLPGAPSGRSGAQVRYKPEDSAVLRHAGATDSARRFLARARSPIARVERSEGGYEVRIEDLRDVSAANAAGSVVAVIALNEQGQVTRDELRFTNVSRR